VALNNMVAVTRQDSGVMLELERAAEGLSRLERVAFLPLASCPPT
jgi:hypothetical protein